jgi:DNA (cytosine-5)-methyltransferase 1
MGLIIDNFAGGGGATTGIEMALGRYVDIAINHDPAAIAMHIVNHPHTKHYCEDVWTVDPIEATQGRPVDPARFCPDCGRPLTREASANWPPLATQQEAPHDNTH